ncbi:NAD(P)-binding protein [Lindgomyces ingoldianus]|uniref:NAD(P)-binding protein n=1 Tax=Lindgomyces ingoldianus TaxID=673940 RepID=A0ACB6QH76_9PLEO|nr:NAD(P)-binding protein [Lindgomyces ingoldianus]KAF2465457.1 NAD(P)-binding protein [Lindgomyces ingoldianus]
MATLSHSVLRSLEAIKTLDSSQFVSCFSPDAVLIDEAKRRTTLASIQEWFEEGLKDHQATIDIKDSGITDAETWVHAILDGNYEADYGITDPFPLYFHYFLRDGKIQLLRINQISPSEPTMRAVWAQSGNESDPISSLRNDILRIPAVPEGWVRVQVAAASLNYHDIFTLRGFGMFELKFPLILGNEAAGTLDDGKDVIIYPVMGNPNFQGDETIDPDRHVLGELTQGSLAEYVVVPKRNIVEKPISMSFETASVLGIAWLTAYRMLFTRSGLKKGQKMLVQGSTGGIATALIQLGRAAGMIVWCVGRSEEKRSIATTLGADRTFTPGEELPEKVAAVFDMSGALTFKHSMECLANGGTLVCCGLHSGGPFAEVDLMKLFTQGISIHGVYAGNKEEFEKLVWFVAEHDIQPYIPVVLPLEQVEEGLKTILDGRVQGKVVIKM